MCGRGASERSGLRGESIWETGGGQKLFSNSFSHRTELTPERSNPFHRTCIDPSAEVASDPSTKVATTQSTFQASPRQNLSAFRDAVTLGTKLF